MEAVLAEHYGIEGAPIVPITRGHTNATFAIGQRFVLRRGWVGKPLARIEREERVLAAAGSPRIVLTKSGANRVETRAGVVHLFERCPGDPGPAYLGPKGGAAMCSAMSELASIHRKLASIDATGARPWSFLAERFDRARAGALPDGGPRVLARIEHVLAFAPSLGGSEQWLHGDFHLGNLLFTRGAVSGVVDYDDTGVGTALAEAAMALFALARRDEGEGSFVFDAELWDEGLCAYGATLAVPREALVDLFCAYQVLIHLEAAQRGWWKLEPGIGFGPCWNRFS